jgi:16S rRNA processing protein RimM
VKGDVKLWSFTEDPFGVADYGPLEAADGRTFEIESLRPAKDFLVARVKDVSDRTAAEALTNVQLYVPRERLPQIDEDETWYVSDLIGLAAHDPSGAGIGTVTAVHNFGAGEIIEIVPANGGPTIMLPFTESAVPDVNVKAKRMTVVVPSEADDVAGDGPHDLS